jgi:hypothetical protein
LKNRITVTILSDVEYENLIAEILIDGKFIGLITNEPDKELNFEVPKGECKFEAIELNVLLEALNLAKAELLQE